LNFTSEDLDCSIVDQVIYVAQRCISALLGNIEKQQITHAIMPSTFLAGTRIGLINEVSESCNYKIGMEYNSEALDGSSGVKVALVVNFQPWEKLQQSLPIQVNISSHIAVTLNGESWRAAISFYKAGRGKRGWGVKKVHLQLTKTKNS